MPIDLQFIGTATTLLSLGPFRILTDPNFLHQGERAHLGYGLTSKRLTQPALRPDELPPLDAVLLSHLHGDHWDRRARAGIDRSTRVLTTRHAARHLSTWQGFRAAKGLRTWEHTNFDKEGASLRVTAVPARHANNPFLNALLPPVMGSVLEVVATPGSAPRRIYITGDTMPFDELGAIGSRFAPIDLAVVHVGGTTLPGGFIVTMTGRDAVDLLQLLRPAHAVPVHYDDYKVFKSGLDDLRREADRANLDVDMRYVERGQSVTL